MSMYLSLEKKSMSFIKFIRILAPVRLKLSPVQWTPYSNFQPQIGLFMGNHRVPLESKEIKLTWWHFPNCLPFLFLPGIITVIFQGPIQNHLLILPSLSTVSYLFFLLMVLLTVRTHFKIFFFLQITTSYSGKVWSKLGFTFLCCFSSSAYLSPLRLR